MQDEGTAVGQAGHTSNLLPTEEDSICPGRSSECRAGTSCATRSSEESGLQQLGCTDCCS